jgi:hypothetical protein
MASWWTVDGVPAVSQPSSHCHVGPALQSLLVVAIGNTQALQCLRKPNTQASEAQFTVFLNIVDSIMPHSFPDNNIEKRDHTNFKPVAFGVSEARCRVSSNIYLSPSRDGRC